MDLGQNRRFKVEKKKSKGGIGLEEAKTDITYCLKTCDKDCWRKASNYVFKGGVERQI